MVERAAVKIKIKLVRFGSSCAGRTARGSRWVEALVNEIINDVQRSQALDANNTQHAFLS
jgi:hypothetical protein